MKKKLDNIDMKMNWKLNKKNDIYFIYYINN